MAIGTHRTAVYRDKDRQRMNVRYWDTDVVGVQGNDVYLDTGGWNTPTTKRRMNQAAQEWGLGYNVYQKKGRMYAQDDINRMTVPFMDNRATLKRRR